MSQQSSFYFQEDYQFLHVIYDGKVADMSLEELFVIEKGKPHKFYFCLYYFNHSSDYILNVFSLIGSRVSKLTVQPCILESGNSYYFPSF